MKSKPLTWKIVATALTALVCFLGWVGLCLASETLDFYTLTKWGMAAVLGVVVANLLIWAADIKLRRNKK